VSTDYETLRWPTNMDRPAIVAKLVAIREDATAKGAADLARFFVDVEDMASARVGASVISALTWLEGKPEYVAVGTQLSMVAMNLKNLK
jgi:hypothetical protein